MLSEVPSSSALVASVPHQSAAGMNWKAPSGFNNRTPVDGPLTSTAVIGSPSMSPSLRSRLPSTAWSSWPSKTSVTATGESLTGETIRVAVEGVASKPSNALYVNASRPCQLFSGMKVKEPSGRSTRTPWEGPVRSLAVRVSPSTSESLASTFPVTTVSSTEW